MTKRRDGKPAVVLGATLGLLLLSSCGGLSPDEGTPEPATPQGLDGVNSCGDGLVGGSECQASACLPPNTACGADCVDLRSANNHCGGCGNVCGQGTACEAGVCVGTGHLQITATWSRPGDADLYLLTPGGRLIHYANRGPDADTEFGALDADDQTGTGPENIFWAMGSFPPVGTYNICLAAIGFDPAPSPTNPVSYTVRVRRPNRPDFITTGSFTQAPASWGCYYGSATYVTSFGHP